MAIRKDETPPMFPGSRRPEPRTGKPSKPQAGEGAAREPRVIAGRFELREVLGNGGMATVYRAWDRQRNQLCAVKLPAENLARDEEFRERFRQEAASASALVHPRIVRVYAHGDADSTPYIVMEYVEGGTLRELMRRRGQLPESLALRLAAEVADALAYAHERRVIHRDIKPHNVLLTPDRHVKVADFGIARTLDETSHTRTGTVLGSTHYISPEQARGEPAGPASDQYSLGVVLYEMLAGRLPFEEAEAPVAMALKHINEPPFDLRWIRPDVSEPTGTLVRRLLAKMPQDRYASAGELAASLRRLCARFGREEAPTAVVPLPVDGAAPARAGDPVAARSAAISPARDGAGLAAALARGATIRLATAGRGPARLSDTARTPVLRARHRRPSVVPRAVLALIALLGLWVFASAAYYAYRSETGARPEGPPAAAAASAPSLIGQTLPAAQRIGASQQFTVAVASSRQDPSAAAGTIVSQDPPANSAIARGGTIHVVLSQGSGVVPNLRGVSFNAAKQQLTASGLRLGNTRYASDDSVAAGVVVSQSPGPSTHAGPKTPVDLVISQGPNQPSTTSAPTPGSAPPTTPASSPGSASGSAVVPSVTGVSLGQAQSTLNAAGLQVGQVSYTYDDRAPAGEIIHQQRAAGSHAAANDAVDLVVSKGPAPKPVQSPPAQNPPAQPSPPENPPTQAPPDQNSPAPTPP